MNSLNSVLLEGVLLDNPVELGEGECTFTIITERNFKVEEEYRKEVSHFGIVTFSNLADSCMKHLTKNRGVRVVGRLKQEKLDANGNGPYSGVVIVAEHVEFKPVLNMQSDTDREVV